MHRQPVLAALLLASFLAASCPQHYASPHYAPHVGQAAVVDPPPDELLDGDAPEWLAPRAMQGHVYDALASIGVVLPIGAGSFALTHFRDAADDRRRFPWIHGGEWRTDFGPTPADRLGALSAAGLASEALERLRERRVVVRYWTEVGTPARPPGKLYMEIRVEARAGVDDLPRVVEPQSVERLMADDFLQRVGARWE